MMVRLHGALRRLAVTLLVVGGFQAEAAELKLLSSLGMQTVFEELAPKFERATGHKLAMTFDSAGGVVKRVHGGEITDVVVTVQQGIERFVKDGKAVPDSVTFIAQSGIGLAVRTGAQK